MTKKDVFLTILGVFIMIGIIVDTILNSGITIENPVPNMTATIMNEVKAYETEYVYNPNIPNTADPFVLVQGINGLDYTYDGLTYVHLSDKVNEVIQVGTGASGNFSGKLTGYGPDCPGCSLVGNVSCLTREGVNHSLISDGLYYTDINYGNLRILAADNSVFPCGTVVKVNNGILNEFYGIVLDTGIAMRNAWRNEQIVWMDLAFSTQKEALTGGATSSNTSFSVQRWGW